MLKNIGSTDQALRILAGIVLIAWALLGNGPTWAWVGVIPLVTGLLNFCPLYRLLGINTRKTR